MAELETRRLGRTEIRAKAFGLGCATIGAPNLSDANAVDTVQRAVELGIDFLDTSPGYQQSERRIGLALRGGLRDKVHLQTKAGTHPDRRHDYSAEAIRWSVCNSLDLLGTDRLDSVLVHDPSDIEDPLGAGRALDELLRMKDEGTIGHVGLGVRGLGFHERTIETGKIDVALTFQDYTLLSQSAAETMLPLARQRDVGVILAGPLGNGQLTGPESDDERAHAIWRWCRDRGLCIRRLALQFCLTAPIDGLVLGGPGNTRELDECFEAATTPIPPEVWREFKTTFGVAAHGEAGRP